MQSQKAVSIYFRSQQILLFGSVEQCRLAWIIIHIHSAQTMTNEKVLKFRFMPMHTNGKELQLKSIFFKFETATEVMQFICLCEIIM